MVSREGFRAFIENSISYFFEIFHFLEVGVSGFFVPRIPLPTRRPACSDAGISSMMEITLVNRCSESDLDVFGLRNL